MASGAVATLGLSTGTLSMLSRKSSASDSLDDPRVIVVSDQNAHSGSQISAEIAQVMMDEAIRQYTGITDIGAAYQSVLPDITANSVIGIKVNCINSLCPTHPVVVNALINGLLQMNFVGNPFPANNIIIWDRSSWSLQYSGYTINSGTTGVRCFGTNTVGYSSTTLNCAGSSQHPSNILTNYCDFLIDFAVMKNHDTAGVTFTMKNHLGSIHNPSGLHGGYCDPYVPALNQQIRDVLDVQESLHIVDAIFGIYYGGPSGSPNMIYDGIILGEDRVAVDAVGRQILDDCGCSTIYRATHIDTAAAVPYNLGTANLNNIEIINIMNPSIAVQNLEVTRSHSDIVLRWSTPEYTGQIKVLRSTVPDFTTFDELAIMNGNTYTDSGVLPSNHKYFYRVLKTW